MSLAVHGGSGGRGSIAPHVLTGKLKSAANVAEVLRLHAQNGAVFNHIHTGACWGALGRVRKPDGWDAASELSPLRGTTRRLLAALDEQLLANVAHGMAKAGVRDVGEWLDLWAELARAAERKLGGFNA